MKRDKEQYVQWLKHARKCARAARHYYEAKGVKAKIWRAQQGNAQHREPEFGSNADFSRSSASTIL